MVMMLGLACLGIALAVFGFKEMAEAREFPQPQKISYPELVRRKPDHGWFQVTGGALMVNHAAWEESVSGNKINRAFVPCQNVGTSGTGKASMLVETKDPSILSQIEQSGNSGQHSGGPSRFPIPPGGPPGFPQAFGGFTGGAIVRPVTGRIPVFNRSSVISSRMASANVHIADSLTPDYIYLAEGESPSMGAAWGFIGMGLGLVALMVAVVVKMIKEQAGSRV
jgi:hypothetical protein